VGPGNRVATKLSSAIFLMIRFSWSLKAPLPSVPRRPIRSFNGMLSPFSQSVVQLSPPPPPLFCWSCCPSYVDDMVRLPDACDCTAAEVLPLPSSITLIGLRVA
jgi:hypothetical protein